MIKQLLEEINNSKYDFNDATLEKVLPDYSGEHDCFVSKEERANCVDDDGICVACGKQELI